MNVLFVTMGICQSIFVPLLPAKIYLSHIAFKSSVYFVLLAAFVLTSYHVFYPTLSFSFFTLLLQVVFVLPRLLFPSGAQANATLQFLSRSCLSTWPFMFNFHPTAQWLYASSITHLFVNMVFPANL